MVQLLAKFETSRVNTFREKDDSLLCRGIGDEYYATFPTSLTALLWEISLSTFDLVTRFYFTVHSFQEFLDYVWIYSFEGNTYLLLDSLPLVFLKNIVVFFKTTVSITVVVNRNIFCVSHILLRALVLERVVKYKLNNRHELFAIHYSLFRLFSYHTIIVYYFTVCRWTTLADNSECYVVVWTTYSGKIVL